MPQRLLEAYGLLDTLSCRRDSLGKPSSVLEIYHAENCKNTKCSCWMWPFIILADRWWDREVSRHPSPGTRVSQLAGPRLRTLSILRARTRAGVGMRESGRSRSQILHNNASDSMSGSGRWYDTIIMTPSLRAKDAKHFYFVSMCHMYEPWQQAYVEREIFVFRWRIVYEGLFVVFVFQQLRCVGLDKSFYTESILIIKWVDCVRGSAVRFMGISW